MHDFRKFLENFGKYMCLIVSTLLLWLVPLLFARLESCSFECNIPLDFNEFLSVRYNVSIAMKSYTFFLKNVQFTIIFRVHPNALSMIQAVLVIFAVLLQSCASL